MSIESPQPPDRRPSVVIEWLLRGLCQLLRMRQFFPGRWRVLNYVERQSAKIARLSPAAVRIGAGYRMWIDPSDFNGYFYFVHGINPREPISKVFIETLRREDTVVDIGANAGYYTALASMRVGPTGRVHAFEASPLLAEKLQILAANRNKNVTVHPVALSDTQGKAEFHCVRSGHTGVSGLKRPERAAPAELIMVNTQRLDDYRDTLGEIRLIKIDVEGAELLVVRGALEVIESLRPYAVLEYSPQWIQEFGSDGDELFSIFTTRGYTAYEIFSGSEVTVDSLELDRKQHDLLFVPPGEPAPTFLKRAAAAVARK